jgi:hypothetical protein
MIVLSDMRVSRLPHQRHIVQQITPSPETIGESVETPDE